MEREEQSPLNTRAELIRQARASCVQRMDGVALKTKAAVPDEKVSEVGNVTWVKFAMIRFICAIIIFLVILTIDQLGIKNNYFDSNIIKQQISSNVTIEQIEKYVSDFIK